MLTVDTETRGLLYKDGVGSVFMVQWADAHGEYVCTEDTGWQPFLDAIEQDDMLVFANAPFDTHHLKASGIVDLLSGRWRIHDVQLLARICLPGRFGYRLEALGTDLLGADSTEQQRALKEAAKRHQQPWTMDPEWAPGGKGVMARRKAIKERWLAEHPAWDGGPRWTAKDKDYYGLWKLEPELMERYGKEDVRLTWDVWQYVWSRAVASDREIYRMEISKVAPILREAEHMGVLVDKDRAKVLKARLQDERDEFRAKLLEQGLAEEAIGVELVNDEDDEDEEATYGKASTLALVESLLAVGVPLYKETKTSGKKNPKTGKVNPKRLSVDKDALTEFQESHPVVKDLLEWRSRCKTLATYIPSLERADPRIHTSFGQCNARTSRMASSQPNMQNLPKTKGVRDVLVPAPGNCILACDYNSIEVYVLAHMIGDPELVGKLEAGFDLYSMVAAKVNGLPYEACLKDGPNDNLRSKAKITALTSMYGGGARLLSVRLGCSVEEAAVVKRTTLDAIPGYFAFDADIKARIKKRTFPHVRTLLGRRLYVQRDKPYTGLNTVIQGNAAELMKLGLVAAYPVAREFGYRPILVVHDEAVWEGPVSCADEAQAAIVKAMETCYPLRPRLGVSANWSTDSYGGAK